MCDSYNVNGIVKLYSWFSMFIMYEVEGDDDLLPNTVICTSVKMKKKKKDLNEQKNTCKINAL